MNWTAEEWAAAAAIAAVSLSTATWAVASFANAITYWRQQDQREWQRLQELVKVIYNNDFESGGLAQIAAVAEMGYLKRRGTVVKAIALAAAEHFRASNPSSALVEELDSLVRKLK